MKRCGDGGDSRDKVAKVVNSSKKTLKLLSFCRNRPVCQVGKTRWIDLTTVWVDAKTQKVDLESREMTLVAVENQLGVVETMDDLLEMSSMLLSRFGEYNHIIDEHSGEIQ